MIYPSGNLVVELAQKRYTKHYYINNKRFASRIGLIDDNFVSAEARMINSLANQKTQIQPIENVVQLDNQYVTYGAAENTTPDDYPDCSSQLQALLEELNPTSNPTKAHCYQYVLDRMNANSNPCVALEEVNKYICEEIEVPEPDPGTPTYTPEQIDQADCLYLLNLWIVMANGLLYDENDRYYINKCYDEGLRYIKNNYVSSPSNVCEIYKYVIENYKCEPEQELETPTEPIKIPIDWVDEGANSNTIEPGYDEGLRKPIWWYHTDHLGSSSYITDNFGRPSHYYDQLPFGESMVEHNQSSYYNNGYKFNGKELDEATGMYYYGARYYDPRISIFVSVDPLAEKTMTPYQYVTNNPIMFTDPTGMEQDGDYYSRSGKYLGSDGEKDNKVYVADNVTKNKDGVVTGAQNAKELPMSHSKFQTTSAIVKHEGVTNDSDEYLWIAHTANNNAKESNSNLYSKLMSGYSSVAKADKIPLSTVAKSQTALFARAAVIDVLSGGIDPTGGATLWDGTDLLAWGLNSPNGTPHNKFEEYNRIVIPGDIYCKFLENTLQKYRSGSVSYYGTKYSLPEGVFNNLSNWKEGNFDFSPGNKEPKSLRATGTRGRSIFWKTIK